MWWYHTPYKSVIPPVKTSKNVGIEQGTHPTDVLLVSNDHMSSHDSSCDLNWNPGQLMFYGRAELKTSDHRYGIV